MRALALALVLFPVIARADVTPTSEMTGEMSTGTTMGTTDSTGEPTGAPPPEYTPCGCRADASLAGSLLVVGLLGLGRRRR